MNFDSYIKQAWTDHATQTEAVAKGFAGATQLIESSDQLAQFSGLVTHVMGEHLGQWQSGVDILSSLEGHPQFVSGSKAEAALQRSIAALKIAAGISLNLDTFSPSDQIRIMAMAAGALIKRDSTRTMELLNRSIDLATSTGLDRADPANQSVAITGNNLACALEEKSGRSPAETELMILAAQTGRTYWERAGTWTEVSRAEYRLAMTYVQAAELSEALIHAQICLKMCLENKAGELDMFYAYEGLAVVAKALGNTKEFDDAFNEAKQFFDRLTPEDKSWCEASLRKLS